MIDRKPSCVQAKVMECCIVPNATAKSPVWVYFGFPGNADGTVMTKKRAICRICSQEMPYKNNLFSHLQHHHRDEYAKLHKTESSQFTSKRGTAAFDFL